MSLQAEGGSYFSYSQNEILQMILTTNVMPPDLARLIGKRCTVNYQSETIADLPLHAH